MKVEVIKLGSIINAFNPPEERSKLKPTILLVEETEDDTVTSYYLSILKEYCKDKFSTIKTSNGIVRSSGEDSPAIWAGGLSMKRPKHISGKSDGLPEVGKSYTIDNGHWGTSKVNIILDNIIFTNNSVYVIHSVSELRDRKLSELGI